MTTWTRGETEVIAGAVRAAPSVHNTQPWVLEFHQDRHDVALFQRLDRAALSDVDIARHSAIPRRRSHRRPFSVQPLTAATRASLVTASDVAGVQARLVRDDEVHVLAKVFDHAARVLRADRGYQRELAMWIVDVADVPARLATLPGPA